MDIEDENNKLPKSTSGESNKWIYLGIFLSVVIIGILLYYFGSIELQNQFVEGVAKFAGEMIWQSV